ncbi:IPT/TIG domain-containing protein [Pedobacter sp. P351]|uniref:IPT/TIG domain-containing protein n=1 Tax=Pedobacter superstes TaxID=3133441 RepID=UPI0030ADC98A
MKKFRVLNIKAIVAIAALTISIIACKKDGTGMPEYGAGDLQVSTIDPGEGSGGDVLIVKGAGLGSLSSITFEKDNVPAGFNPVFNEDKSVVFRIPDTAGGGPQNIIFTNTAGKSVKIPFKVVALPVISQSSAIDIEAGQIVTLTGTNLEDVSQVVIDGTTTEAEIVSMSKKQLTIKIPASSASRVKLSITNSSGTKVGEQEFTYVANAYAIYGDAFNSNVDNWSWSTEFKISTLNKISGSNGLSAEYTGGWGGIQLAQKSSVSLTPYKYLTFWTKGSATDRVVSLNFNWAKGVQVTIPAGKWTYHKIDLDTFKGSGVNSLDNLIMQINGDPDLFFFDNILLVK